MGTQNVIQRHDRGENNLLTLIFLETMCAAGPQAKKQIYEPAAMAVMHFLRFAKDLQSDW